MFQREISSLCIGGNLYCFENIGWSSVVGMLCCKTVVAPKGSPGM